jgi:RHS repeat-associated protein
LHAAWRALGLAGDVFCGGGALSDRLNAQVTISPNNVATPNPPTVAAFTTGNTTTFAVQYFTPPSGIDRRFRFTCTAFGGVTVTSCPSQRTLTSGGPPSTISVTYSTGAAGAGGLRVRVDQTLPSGPLTATGRRDFTVTAPSGSLVASGDAAHIGVGASGTTVFVLTNTGPLASSYAMSAVPASCAGALSGCSVTPSTVTALAPNATQILTAAFNGAAPGVQSLTVQANAGGNTVATASNIVNVLSAAMQPSAASTTVIAGPSQQSYNQITVANAPGSPAMTVDLSVTCSGVLTACMFDNGLTSLNVLLPAGAAPAITFRFNASTAGTGAFTVSASANGVPVGGSTLTVTAQAPAVVASLTPVSASMPVTVAPQLQTYDSYTLTNAASSPTATINLSVDACTLVSSCQFDTGSATKSVTLSPGQSIPVPFSFVAGGAGSTTLTIRAASDAGTLATATLQITAAAASTGMIVVTQGLTTDSLLYRDECVSISLDADAASECGDLRVVHALPAIRTMNVLCAPVMTYSSAHARAVTVVPAELTLPASVTLTGNVSASLRVNDVQYASGYWPAGDWTPGSTRRVVLLVDNINNGAQSGVYPYVLQISAPTSNGTVVTESAGQFVVVNRSASPFGSGWWIAGYERLDLANPGRLVWTGGDGSVRVYNQLGGTSAPFRAWGAASASYPDSIREGTGSTFVRQLPDSVWVTFDAAGRHASTRNALGHVTSFAYSGSGRLTSITAPTGAGGTPLQWTFGYGVTSKLATITAPGDTSSRLVTWRVNTTTGRLDAITDPGAPTRTIQLGYVAGNLLVSRTNGRGAVTRFAYDSALKVRRASLALTPGDSISRALTNWQSFGLAGVAADTGTVHLAIDGPRSGQRTVFRVNQYGAPSRVVSYVNATDSLVTSVARLNASFPTLVTQSISPTAYVVDALYDTRGRLLTQSSLSTSGAMAVTEFAWDQKWDELRVAKNPEGDSTTFGVEASTGNRLWQQDARGVTSRINYGYNSANQVTSVQRPLRDAEGFAYDAQGNLKERYNELEMTWKWTNNAIGLTTIAETPFGDGTTGVTWTPRAITYFGYSGRNQVLQSWTATGSKRDSVVTTFDEEDNPLTISRTWRPNPQAIAPQVSTMAYDDANRVIRTLHSTGGSDSSVYDVSGNVVQAHTRRNEMVSMSYDWVNRMQTRSVPAAPAYTYPSPKFSPSQGIEMVAYGMSRPAETQVFTYHASGQIASATGLDADVLRTYHPNGALLTDTLWVRDSTRATTPHVYWLTLTYDRNGRRLTRALGPTALFPGAAMGYGYTTWGALGGISDIAGNAFSLGYNVQGELQTVGMPGGISRTLGYDGAGRLSSDVIANANAGGGFPFDMQATLRNFSITKRNARGQIITATDPASLGGPIPLVTYDSAGFLVRSNRVQNGYRLNNGSSSTFEAADTMVYDGLANILSAQGYWSATGCCYQGYTTTNAYNLAGRLSTQLDSRSGTAGGGNRFTAYEYDVAGNTRFEGSKLSSGEPFSSGERASYYGADDRLIGTDVRSYGKRLLEEYRYDALGRRIWVRSLQQCAPTNTLACVTSGVTRTIWDGADEVAEIRAPIGANHVEELDSGWPLVPWTGVGDANPFVGRVVYAPGLVVDEPLSVTRFAYRDQPDVGTSATWPTFTLMPFWDYRGTPVFGVTTQGARAIPLATGGTSCPNPGVPSPQRCVLLTWPYAWDAYRRESGNLLTLSWHGSVLQTKRDGSGLQFMRNRQYDPATGRFTQEDPIGLAGGLNAYGYAGGDPVNSSDPFGLCEPPGSKACQIIEGIGKRLKEPEKVLTAYAGGVAIAVVGAVVVEIAGSASVARAMVRVPANGAVITAGSAVAGTSKLPFSGFAAWGRNLWGRGAEGALQAASQMTAEQAALLDPGKVRAALAFYENAVALGRGGVAATERVALMRRILELSPE